MNKRKFSTVLWFLLISLTFLAEANTESYYEIANDDLKVRIRKDNGAIDHYIFKGVNFFAQGSKISDWGVQLGNSNSGFFRSDTNGYSNFDVDVIRISANEVQMVANIESGVFKAKVIRSLKVVPDINALAIRYVVENQATDAAYDIAVFENFDPDQARVNTNSYGAYEDVDVIDGVHFAQDIDDTGMSFVLGVDNEKAVLSTDNVYRVYNYNHLKSILFSPGDADGTKTDGGFNFAYQETLYPGDIFRVELAGGAGVNKNPSDVIANIKADVAAHEVAKMLELNLDWNEESTLHIPLEWSDLQADEPEVVRQNSSKSGSLGGKMLLLGALSLMLGRGRKQQVDRVVGKRFQ